jgi:hypothetical protein
MSKKTVNAWLFGIGAAAGAMAAGYTLVVRPRIVQRWGASDEEVSCRMPGDELVPDARLVSTRAITIQAPPEQVWPWLVQIGYQRAGWYSYDTFEEWADVANFVDGPSSSRRIVPELQNLRPGDWIYTHPDGGFLVDTVEPQRMLILRTQIHPRTGQTVDLNQPLDGATYRVSWAFQLSESGPGQTRLVIRFRAAYPSKTWLVVASPVVLEPVVFLMEQKMLKGIKERAESSL